MSFIFGNPYFIDYHSFVLTVFFSLSLFLFKFGSKVCDENTNLILECFMNFSISFRF